MVLFDCGNLEPSSSDGGCCFVAKHEGVKERKI
jgi:hypothetical protein